VYRENRSIGELKKELETCDTLLKEQRTLRKNRVRESNPNECVVPETGLAKGGWRYEAKLLRAAAKRLETSKN
jgi:hypothetical protein